VLRIYERGGRAVWLVMAIAIAALLADPVQAAPTATISTCTFTPTEGGPGTLVHAAIDQWFAPSPVVGVSFAVPTLPRAPAGTRVTFDPSGVLKLLGPPLTVMRPINGHAETTFRVPARLPLGQSLPLHDLYLVCTEGGTVDMGAGGDPVLFTFRTTNLPVTGQPLWPLYLPLLMSGIALMIGGVRLRASARSG